VPFASDDSWVSYARTVVDVSSPSGETLRVRADPEPGGVWSWPDTQPVHILTAWDPGSERPGHEANCVRQATLETELKALGWSLSVAVGVDPVTQRREEGVAVRGAREAEILAVAAHYGQDAIFAWTPLEWAVVACRGERRLASGWSLESVAPGFPFSRVPDVPI
jgi:hypothetical protein